MNYKFLDSQNVMLDFRVDLKNRPADLDPEVTEVGILQMCDIVVAQSAVPCELMHVYIDHHEVNPAGNIFTCILDVYTPVPNGHGQFYQAFRATMTFYHLEDGWHPCFYLMSDERQIQHCATPIQMFKDQYEREAKLAT